VEVEGGAVRGPHLHPLLATAVLLPHPWRVGDRGPPPTPSPVHGPREQPERIKKLRTGNALSSSDTAAFIHFTSRQRK
jgi:hypothetical protein